MIRRASPAQQRKALEIANLFVKMGVGFVPVPVANSEEFDKLVKQSNDRLAEMEASAAASEDAQNNDDDIDGDAAVPAHYGL